MAKDRETRIPEDNGYEVPEGWELDGEGFAVPDDQPDSLLQALVDAAGIVRHIGGVIQIAPVRRELGPGIYVTTEFVMRWNSFSPPVAEEPAVQAVETDANRRVQEQAAA